MAEAGIWSSSGAPSIPLEISTSSGSQVCSVAFPVRQPGLSALVGVYGDRSRSFVVKVAKTTEVSRWSRVMLGTTEPLGMRLTRRLTARWNSLAPSPAVWTTLAHFSELCHEWLASPAPQTLESALREIPAADGAVTGEFLDELHDLRGTLRFAPRSSEVVRATFPGAGPTDVFALIQENVGSLDEAALAVTLPVGRRRVSDAEPRLADKELLVLLAYAALLARESGLGLDLAPRIAGGRLFLPNVLTDVADGAPVYVDYFGLAQRDGNSAESAAFHALYGRRGLIRLFCRSMYRRLIPYRGSKR